MDDDSIPLLTDIEFLHYDSNVEMQIPMISNKFSISKLIYETANSVVVSATIKNEKCAIKFIPIDNEANAKKEALIMQEKKHPHIIKFINSIKSDTFFAIVMSLAMTDLTQYTKGHRFLPEKVAKKVMFDCLNAVEYLHKDGIWHLDLKTDNIFVMKDSKDGPDVAIGDFGLACSTEYEKIEGRPVGSLNYAPPELIQLDYSQCYECSFLDEAQCLLIF